MREIFPHEPLKEITNCFANSGGTLEESNLLVDANNDIDLQIEQMIEKNGLLWECKVCGKTFVRKNHAKSHTEIHLNGISHDCSVCSKTFHTRDSMRVHVKNAHSDATFVCNVCGKSGMSRMIFKNHKYQSKCAKK